MEIERYDEASRAVAREAELHALVESLGVLESSLAAMTGLQARVLASVLALTEEATRGLPERVREHDLAVRAVSAEIGAALRISDRSVQRKLSAAWQLTEDFPATHQALLHGRISAAHASTITDAGAPIDDADARATFEARALVLAEVETAPRLRALLSPLAEQVRATTIEERHREARAARRVEVRDLADGMSELWALLPTVLAHGIHDRLSQLGRAVADAERTSRNVAEPPAPALTGMPSVSSVTPGTGRVVPDVPRAAGMVPSASDIAPGAPGVVPGAPGVVPGASGVAPCASGVAPGTSGVAPGAFGVAPGGSSVASGPHSVAPRAAADAGEDACRRNAVPTSARTLDQIRADALCDLALGASPVACGDGIEAIRAHVTVSVPVLTLAGVTDTGAELVGRGAIDATTARALAGAASGWDRVMTHPVSGSVLAVDRYRPSEDLRRTIRVRDQHCRFPGCRLAARRCDVDHTVDAALGGATDACNLACLCRRHHVLKHHSRWRVHNDGTGVLTWTSPQGRVYVDAPPPAAVAFAPARGLSTGDGPPPPF